MTVRTRKRKIKIMNSRLNVPAAAAGFVVMFGMLASPAAAQPRWGRPRAPRAGACFYQDDRFRGEYFCVEAGDDVASMPSGMNDEITSIQTFGDVEVEIFQDVRFSGRSKRFDSSVRNLGDDWNDRLSSIRVTRRRDRYEDRDDRRREVMTRSRAEDIVRRAYQSVLKRDPDPASRSYVDKVMNDRWSQADVEKELRNSEEYRNRKR
jgi:hypothetical protein